MSFLIDKEGRVVSEYVYDVWGNLLSISGSLVQPYQYLSYYSEVDIGLYLVGRRWYDSKVGRYISRNSFYALSSPYLFSNNNPVSSVGTQVNFVSVASITIIDPIVVIPDPRIYDQNYETPIECAKRISDEVFSLKEPIEGDRWSLWKHCVTSCRIVRECPGGWLTAIIAGWWQEISDWAKDSWCDLRANAIGRGLANSNKSCEEACKEAWEKGDLPKCCNKK